MQVLRITKDQPALSRFLFIPLLWVYRCLIVVSFRGSVDYGCGDASE